jgi:hypothetical protein
MTIFAGAFSLTNDGRLPESLRGALRAAVSRADNEVIDEIRTDSLFFVKVDIGAFGAKGLHEDAYGNVTAIAGEPLIDAGEADLSHSGVAPST